MRNHSTNLRRKLDVRSSLAALIAAVRLGVLTLDEDRREIQRILKSLGFVQHPDESRPPRRRRHDGRCRWFLILVFNRSRLWAGARGNRSVVDVKSRRAN